VDWHPIQSAPTRREVLVYHDTAARYGATAYIVAWKDEQGIWHDDYNDDGKLVNPDALTHWLELDYPRPPDQPGASHD
jgi:hypothetical protein